MPRCGSSRATSCGVALHTESSEEEDADEDVIARLYGAFGDGLRVRCRAEALFRFVRVQAGRRDTLDGPTKAKIWARRTENSRSSKTSTTTRTSRRLSTFPWPISIGTLWSFVLLREAEDGDEDVDEDHTQFGSGDEGEYLVGVSDDGKVVVIKLDGGARRICRAPRLYDGEGPVTSIVYDGDAVYFTSRCSV